ncbi:MAG: excinuclease ABC subunit UvrC [Clostridia bacterium]|nr:excinuclease ABC subunit UvrC [Clostridia bacterium]
MEKRKQLRAQAMALPLSPGVYLMKDRRGTVIYVGKAKQLKNRVSQYFGSDTGHSAKVRRMVSLVDTFDYIVADSEFEALVLECSLIKQYAPKYNVLLKDDKGYRYIRVSPPPFSRISEAKQKQEDGATYIGPYMSSFGIRQAIDEASRVFGLSTCNRTLCYGRKPLPTERPCLNHHIGQCCAPCTGRVTEAEYAERVENALDFILQGSSAMIASLEQRMNAAAEALEFERAAELRDRIAAIRRMSDRQKVVMSRVPEQDVIAAVASGDRVCAEVFRFQGGSLTDKEEFVWDEAENTPAFRTEFISRYYSLRDRIPPQITVDGDVEDAELLERWLTEKAGRRVHIVQPQIGQQAQLTEMCRKNAAEHLARQTGMSGRETAALDELARLLDLSAPPHRIECYDISNTAGSDNVAGMVVYLDGKPAKAEYRLFKIQSIIGQDDYGSMREVLSRRILEYEANRGEESGFGQMPDLILLDGGNEHVSAVKPLLDAAGWTVPLYGLVKDDKHRTRAIAHGGGETAIRSNRACFTLLSSIQEEVHRFAIGYHRRSRSKSNIRTSLTAIEGIGPTRAAELLRVFGSVKAISRATVEQLLTVRGMTRPAAEAVVRALQQKENENGTDSIG